MEENQTINCTVNSCKYQDENNEKCTLKTIVVEPKMETATMKPDESMCGNYKSE